MPAMGVRPPFLMLAAVRAMAPVAGIPPNSAEQVLPRPCATSSILELWRAPIISSATTALSRDSMAARMAMVNASGSTVCTSWKLKLGMWKLGRALEMVYRSPMVLTGSFRPLTRAAHTMTAMREGGTRGRNRGRTMRMARETNPMTTAIPLKVPMQAATSFSFSMVSTGACWKVRPMKSFS